MWFNNIIVNNGFASIYIYKELHYKYNNINQFKFTRRKTFKKENYMSLTNIYIPYIRITYESLNVHLQKFSC